MAKVYQLADYRKAKPAHAAKVSEGQLYTTEQLVTYSRKHDFVYHRPGGAPRIDLWLAGKEYVIKQDDSQSSQMSVYVAGKSNGMWWYSDTVHGCKDSKLADAIHATCESYWAVRDCRKDKVYLMCDIWPYAAARLRKTEEL